ncbi:DNA-directed RNA polymerase III subunit 2-like [Cornus florida]|uniref:DNA-directed RNA polymerase III subunit 2-like n=1 Tax=Cornus florida TaxID=4283 RepID=UPI00289CE1B4|nr:DNA-directed RNA polymerase III subunit 2-like [Cornus florida]
MAQVILIQEQLSKNRIIIDTNNKGCIQASVTSSTETRKSKTSIVMEKEKIYLNLNQFSTKVPIMVVMKAMGMESDQEVVQMVGRDPRYSALLLPSIEECASHNVYTQEQALEFLEKKVKKMPFFNALLEEEGRALGILRDVFIANVPVRQHNFRAKCIYVAVMLRRMMEAILNKDAMDDKDYVGNKRLELSGQLLSLLFEDLFKTMNDEIRKNIDLILGKHRSSPLDVSQYIVKDTITVGLERTLSTGNFDVKRFRMHRKGMTQVVARLSFMGTLGHMTKISPQFEKSRKVSGPRALQPSQWGMLCPCDTPEGEACGLVKNLALMTHVTTDEEEGPLISLCYCLGVENLELLSGEELHTPNSYLILLNGLILGKHRRPQLRRAGRIGEFVSIFVNEKQVLDKMHARGSGPRVMITRQPTDGRSRNGGLRVGEMERDCLIAYGTSMLIFERLMISSDPFEVQVCRKCGLLGYYNYKLKTGICSTCKNGENISTMKLPYACKLLFQELQSMNIVPRLQLAEA